MEDVEGKKIKEGDLLVIPVLITKRCCYNILESLRVVRVVRMTEKSMWVTNRNGEGKEFLIRPDSKKVYKIA